MALENNKKQGFIPAEAVRASNEARNPATIEKAPGANTDMYSQERVMKNQPATDASDDALGG